MSPRGRNMVINSDDEDVLAEAGLTSIGCVMKYQPGTGAVAAQSGSSEVFAVDLSPRADKPAQVFVKRYRYRGWRARMASMFRGGWFGKSRARFEYEFLHEMRRRCVPAVRPMAYGEARRLGLLKACFLITAGEPDVESLDTFALGRGSHQAIPTSLTVSLAHEIRRMHDAGVRHGGLYWRNILIKAVESAGGETKWQFFILDPDRRAKLHAGPVPRSGQVSDLSDLAASALASSRAAELIRFARAYFDVQKLWDVHKSILRDARAAASKKAGQEQHRLAMGGAIAWLNARIAAAAKSGVGAGFQVGSVEEFFRRLARVKPAEGLLGPAQRCIHFIFTADGAQRPDNSTGSSSNHVTLRLAQGAISVENSLCGAADLTVETEAEVWLAIVNGQKGAFDQVRRGRIKITGDTRLLTVVAQLMS